ncbi:hypothetical protein NDU88_005597 [Pleurodeles waltl]|uniref:Uncharacterized protein n=1 Tax=Pleurodeles waltl TaxID=8319 RepID=A0AAV7RMN1_PLEWA|nr:hypothetical protein NDU88_005597 [Pleurodeles waltl]
MGGVASSSTHTSRGLRPHPRGRGKHLARLASLRVCRCRYCDTKRTGGQNSQGSPAAAHLYAAAATAVLEKKQRIGAPSELRSVPLGSAYSGPAPQRINNNSTFSPPESVAPYEEDNDQRRLQGDRILSSKEEDGGRSLQSENYEAKHTLALGRA